MKRLIFIFILPLFTISCATFEKTIAPQKLDKENLQKINGVYNNKNLTGRWFCLTDVFDRNTSILYFITDKEKYNNNEVKVALNIVSDKRINVKVIDSVTEKIIFDKNLRCRLKRDGYLYLKHKSFMIDGIPLICGGFNVQKSRMYINSDGILNVESRCFFISSALVILIGGSGTETINSTFKKQP